ncbi:MAG: FG-GAP-like repeat-containing protein [candidate division WOR-3 bacterium]
MRKIIFILIFLSLVIKLYSYWRIKRILFSPIGGTASYPIVVDSDHNGYNEIIFSIYRCWQIWEYRPINQYYLVYADTGGYPGNIPGIETGNFEPKDVGDIDQDGLVDLVGPNVENVNDSFFSLVTTQESPDYHSYPESLSWWYRTSNEYAFSYTYYFTPDLDNDGKNEILTYESWDSCPIVIIENISNNTNIPVWRKVNYGSGFAFGDFDGDRLKEFVTASPGSSGRVFVFENTGDNQYQLVKVDTVRLPNGIDVFSGNDVDNDGKPEFFVGFAEWAGGHAWDFYLYMWEAVGNNNYQRTLIDRIRMDELGRRSKCGDIDGDGIEEIVWSIGGQVRVYKAIGNNQFQNVWFWRNDHGYPPTSIVNIYDVNGNGYNEILVSGYDHTSIFEIEAVQVLRPNGGEIFSGNSQEVIRWKTFYPPRCDSLSLYYSTDNGRTYHLIASGIPGRETTYLWQVPNISSDSCKIRIVAYGPGWQFDESDMVFRIRETGIEEKFFKTFYINISQNPIFSFDLSVESEIKIYDIKGNLIKKEKIKDGKKTKIFLKEMKSGIYFIEIGNKKGKIVLLK